MKLIIVILGTFVVFAAANAQPFSSDEEIEIDDTITYGLLDKLKCKLCEEAFRPIVKEIKKDSSKEEIKKALDRACTIIPEKRLRTKCRDGVKNHGDEIAEKIIAQASIEAICKILQFC